jgi:hypothetical protein
MFLDQETAQEKPITDAISTVAAQGIKAHLPKIEAVPFARVTVSG